MQLDASAVVSQDPTIWALRAGRLRPAIRDPRNQRSRHHHVDAARCLSGPASRPFTPASVGRQSRLQSASPAIGYLYALFGALSKGEIYTLANVRRIRRLGELAARVRRPANRPADRLVGTAECGHLPGERRERRSDRHQPRVADAAARRRLDHAGIVDHGHRPAHERRRRALAPRSRARGLAGSGRCRSSSTSMSCSRAARCG